MRRAFPLVAAATAAVLMAGLAVAQQGEDPLAVAVEIRQGQMLSQAMNIGVLGGMAQGKADYDAASAQAAADNLVYLASIHWGYMWPEGSEQGKVEGSAATPAVWTDMADFEAKHQAFLDAATAMQAAAGTDLASLQGAMGPLGASCGGCHELYRAKE